MDRGQIAEVVWPYPLILLRYKRVKPGYQKGGRPLVGC
jgi:hypothetical protein